MKTTLEIPDSTVHKAGELAHLHEETLRIQQIIDQEFEQIEPEDWT